MALAHPCGAKAPAATAVPSSVVSTADMKSPNLERSSETSSEANAISRVDAADALDGWQ